MKEARLENEPIKRDRKVRGSESRQGGRILKHSGNATEHGFAINLFPWKFEEGINFIL